MSKEQKIDNTFNKVMDDINRLQKAFQPNKNLEKAIAEVGGDISWLKEINESFDKLYDMLEEGHMGAVAHLQMDEELSKKKKIKPNTPVGMVAEGVLDSDDDDGFMARSQLYFLARDAIKLHSVIDDRDDLEPWVASKIAQASKDMDSVRRYTEYNAMKAEVEPEMQPAPEVESLEEDPEARKMQVTNADRNANTEAWKRFRAGDPRYEYIKPKEINLPVKEGTMIGGLMKYDGQPEGEYADAVAKYKEFMSKPRPASEETTDMVQGFVFDDDLLDSLDEAQDNNDVDVRHIVQSRLEDFFGPDFELGLDEAIRPVRSASSKLNQIGQGVRNKTNDETPMKVGEQKKKKKYEAVKEETKFDDKNAHSELKTVAQDMFKHALANAKKKARK